MPTDAQVLPIDHPWFATGDPPVVLAAGRFAPAKDFETLVRAFAKVASDRPVRLVLLGEGKQRARIENLIRELGLGGITLLPGFVDNPFAWMSPAAVFVLSSAWEGSPGVLIEAMARGCPVVSTDCLSGPAEILEFGAYGRLVAVGDINALAQAIAETLDAPRNPDRLRARAAEFDVETAVDGYLDVLMRVR
jgi:glycosyltransferase involved in cell wall biosynthesis